MGAKHPGNAKRQGKIKTVSALMSTAFGTKARWGKK